MLVSGTVSDSFYRFMNEGPIAEVLGQDFLGRTFSHLPDEQRADIVRMNECAFLGRSVAGTLSRLLFDKNSSKTAYDSCGPYINLIGHSITASIFKMENVENSAQYISRVEEVTSEIFNIIENNKSLPLKDQSIVKLLNKIDVPDNAWSHDVKIENPGMPTIADTFTELFTDAFATNIVTRGQSTLDKSLRAYPLEDRKKKILEAVKEWVAESGAFKNFEELPLLTDASCILLEGKEIQDWVHKAAETMNFTPAQLQKINPVTPEALRKVAIEIVFNEVVQRMENFADKNPLLSLTPQELKIFLMQDFYPRMIGIKMQVDSTNIEEARQGICPGILPIQYPRVTVCTLPLKNVEPLQLERDEEKMTIIDYLKEAQKVLNSNALNVMICHLKREKADRASTLAIEHFKNS